MYLYYKIAGLVIVVSTIEKAVINQSINFKVTICSFIFEI